MTDREPIRVELTAEGPVLIHGPVDLVTPDGHHVSSQRTVTALCTCRRSRRFPMCDTSHRRQARHRAKGTDDEHSNTHDQPR